MKKVLLLIGAAVLVMALATPSMAQFKTWGHTEIHTVYYMNRDNNLANGTGSGGDDVATRYIAQRFRFYLSYGDPKTVRAVIGFEGDASRWGTTSGGRNNMGELNTDEVALEIKHSYLDFVIPKTPLSVRAGMFWWDIGGRFNQAQDAPGIKLTANFAPHAISAFMYRAEDQNTNNYNVEDTYGLVYTLKQKQFDMEAYFQYVNDLRDDAFANHPWWLGVGAGYRPGNWDFAAYFTYLGGTMESKVSGVNDIDYKAWAAEASARYRIGPGLFVGIEGFYSTGNDADATDESNRYMMSRGSEAYSGFGNWRGVYFYKASGVFGPSYDAYQGSFSTYWPWGTYYADVNVEYSPTPWLKLVANYMYIGDTAEGTPGAGKVVNTPRGARQDKDEDYVGSEINLIASMNIYKGFLFNIGAGYFMPGDVFDTPSKSADPGYNVMSRLVYSF